MVLLKHFQDFPTLKFGLSRKTGRTTPWYNLVSVQVYEYLNIQLFKVVRKSFVEVSIFCPGPLQTDLHILTWILRTIIK